MTIIDYPTSRIQCFDCGQVSDCSPKVFLGTAGVCFCTQCQKEVLHLAVGFAMTYPIAPMSYPRSTAGY